MEEDREYTVLMENMQYALQEVRAFNFYTSFVNQIQEKPGIMSNIFRDVNSSAAIPMVIYGLGRIQYSYVARFQLALALLLREVPGLEINHEIIVCCDSLTLNDVEERVMTTHGCKIMRMTDGRFKWRVDELTLFFLPFTRPEVVGDLLGMNWCSSQLEKMIILGSSLSSLANALEKMVSTCDSEQKRPTMAVKKLTYITDKLRYLWAVWEYTWEFDINEEESPPIDKSQSYNPEDLFQNLCWHGFDFDGIDIVEEDMNNFLPSTESCFKWVDDDTSYPYRMDEDDIEELPKLQHEMEITMIELRESEHYMKFRDQLHDNHLLKNEISRRLGSMEQVQMVIYGLGTLEYYFDSHYQLAFALLLKEEIDILKIGEIQVFDPVITPLDAALIRSLGCTVLPVNEYAWRRVEKPTLFFMPFVWRELVGNLLESNWLPSRLENLIILGTSMHTWAEDVPDYGIFKKSEMRKLMEADRSRYMITIKDWSVDFTVDRESEVPEQPLNQFYWVFFNLLSELDMSSILPSFPTINKIEVDHENAIYGGDDIRKLHKRMERCYVEQFNLDNKRKNKFRSSIDTRGPSKYLKTWSPPQLNWIKLNFDGYNHETSGYGGFLCNAKGEILLSYAGPISDGKDKIEAQIEGLRQGVRCFKQLMSSSFNISNLIIEGSALSVIRWALVLLPTPHKFVDAYEEMSMMLEETNCIVQYIYEEANIKARELAKLGMTLSELSIWRYDV